MARTQLYGYPYVADVDANGRPSLIAVSGTAGTADTTGTAEIIRLGANPVTGALYVEDMSGASGTSNVKIVAGTLPEVGNLAKGTVTALASGTITGGTLGNLNAGTITSVANVANGTLASVGTIPGVGVVTTITDISNGSLSNVANIHNAGTLNAGTLTLLSNLNSGSVVMTVGTLTTGTLQNLVSGTINALASGTVTGGTLGNLVSGTINALASGTITNGTVSTLGLHHADEFATVVSAGTSALGTVKAAVSGSVIYVTGMVISVGSASNVTIASGGTSTPILGTLFFSANGGVAAMPFDPPIRTASGSALVYQQSVNGPISITAVGYVD